MKNESSSCQQQYQQIKSRLLDQRRFPNTNKLLNLPSFVRQNQSLFIKLNNELNQLKNHQKKVQRNIKIKTTPFYLNNSAQSKNGDSQKLIETRERNQLLQKNIAALKAEEQRKKLEILPILKQKKEELKQKQMQKQRLQQLNRQLKNAYESQDMLELYQAKCRQCESLRKVNNEISEQIKAIIKEINELTGSEENPNMFFMNLKV